MSRLDATENRLRETWELAVEAGQRSLRTVRGTPGLLMLSALLGVSFWVFVTEEENPTRVDDLGTPLFVQSFNVEPGLAVANQFPAVELTLAAPEERWEEIAGGLGSFRAFVDLNGITEREQEVTVQIEIDGVRGVRVVEVSPEKVTVNLEDLTSVEVPVRVRPVGTMPLGYELRDTSMGAPTVTVTGPESLVSRVSDAVADLNVTGLTHGVDQTVTLIPRGAGGGENPRRDSGSAGAAGRRGHPAEHARASARAAGRGGGGAGFGLPRGERDRLARDDHRGGHAGGDAADRRDRSRFG